MIEQVQLSRKEQLITECSEVCSYMYFCQPDVIDMHSLSEQELESLLDTMSNKIED